MGFLDFFKPKHKELNISLQQMINAFFPHGEKDVETGTQELLHILNDTIDEKEARIIFIRSFSLCCISKKFDKARLKSHLKGYCIQHFNENQIEKFHGYLSALIFARVFRGKTPSEVIRKGNSYFW
jgi:hypothetical protein